MRNDRGLVMTALIMCFMAHGIMVDRVVCCFGFSFRFVPVAIRID